MEWIGKELRDEVDFVIWTGDSARHDNDDDYPRTAEQVIGLNEFMVQKVYEVFGKRNGDGEDEDPYNDYVVPVVPNIGNNDILPHNIMTKGPNRWTRSFLDVWRQFIPEVQKHSFEQGGWFSVEVIPNKLAVFSLNTMYFFQSNAAVDGCAAKSEPGFRQMEWLRIQLQFMRDRGMKAIMIGHVPPAHTDTKTQWDETCWQKYTLWMQQYRDVVIAGMWGHMNYDHFMFQDFNSVNQDAREGRMKVADVDTAVREIPDDEMHAEVSSDYFTDLRKQFSEIPKPPKSFSWASTAKKLMESSDDQRPMWEIEALLEATMKGDGKAKGVGKGKDKKSKKQKRKEKEKKFFKDIGGKYAERYSVSFASASVVPNLLPVLRVYEYNISGLDSHQSVERRDLTAPETESSAIEHAWSSLFDNDEAEDDDEGLDVLRKKKDKSQKFVVPDPPSKSSPPGPAYSPQSLTLLGYKQYLANLTHINNDFTNSKDEDSLHQEEPVDAAKWSEGKHKGKKPHDKEHKPNPNKFEFQLHYDTRNDSVYNLPDLTIPSMLGLARDIGACERKESGSLALEEWGIEEGDVPGPESGDDDNDDQEFGVEKKKKKKGDKKHKKKKKGKKHQKCQANEAWHTFIRRAFVETLDAEDIGGDFGN